MKTFCAEMDNHIKTYENGMAPFVQRLGCRRLASGFDGAGCALLTGSDAGNVPSRPLSNLSCISLSDFCACFGSSACLSFGAGLNFSVIAVSHVNQPTPPWSLGSSVWNLMDFVVSA